MNVLVTLNSNYLKQLAVMLTSLIQSNPEIHFDVYIAHTSMIREDFTFINQHIDTLNCTIMEIRIPDDLFNNAPITRRYPKEMYYRIFAAQFLPKKLDRILYLDPDVVTINSVNELYNIDFQENLFAAATDVRIKNKAKKLGGCDGNYYSLAYRNDTGTTICFKEI